jgi:hypothetical protein
VKAHCACVARHRARESLQARRLKDGGGCETRQRRSSVRSAGASRGSGRTSGSGRASASRFDASGRRSSASASARGRRSLIERRQKRPLHKGAGRLRGRADGCQRRHNGVRIIRQPHEQRRRSAPRRGRRTQTRKNVGQLGGRQRERRLPGKGDLERGDKD